jgi:general secretion pathway protein C
MPRTTQARLAEDSDDFDVVDRMRSGHQSALSNANRWAATLATVALLATTAWYAAELTWQVMTPPGQSTQSLSLTPTTGRPLQVVDNAAVNLAPILAANLFGQMPGTTVEEVPPDTTLALTLKGIVYSDVVADARAIIDAAEGPQLAYGVGTWVPGDAQVQEIRSDHVILGRNGLRETLRLEKVVNANTSGREGTPNRRYDERGNYPLSRALARYQARLKTDPAAAISLVRLVPERNGTAMLGVRLYPGAEPGLLRQASLEPGDLVTHINGIALDSAQRGLEALRNLTAATELDLQVLRGRRRLAFSFLITP